MGESGNSRPEGPGLKPALGYLLAAVMGVGLMVSANPWALLGLFLFGGVYNLGRARRDP